MAGAVTLSLNPPRRVERSETWYIRRIVSHENDALGDNKSPQTRVCSKQGACVWRKPHREANDSGAARTMYNWETAYDCTGGSGGMFLRLVMTSRTIGMVRCPTLTSRANRAWGVCCRLAQTAEIDTNYAPFTIIARWPPSRLCFKHRTDRAPDEPALPHFHRESTAPRCENDSSRNQREEY